MQLERGILLPEAGAVVAVYTTSNVHYTLLSLGNNWCVFLGTYSLDYCQSIALFILDSVNQIVSHFLILVL